MNREDLHFTCGLCNARSPAFHFRWNDEFALESSDLSGYYTPAEGWKLFTQIPEGLPPLWLCPECIKKELVQLP